METSLLSIIIISEIISVILIFRMIRSVESAAFKTVVSLLTLLPIIGPVFYGICMLDHPLTKGLENRGNRGHFTHDWIGAKADLDEINKTLTEISENKERNKSDAKQESPKKSRGQTP